MSGRLVLGVDAEPDPEDDGALRFAADEATRRGAEVLVLFGCEPLMTPTSLAPVESLEDRRRLGEQVTEAVAGRLRAMLPPALAVRTLVSPETGVDMLVSLSGAASMIVLERHPHTTLHRLHAGSTTSRVCARAGCPVAVVRAGGGSERRGIVVGVDGRGHSALALDTAFAEADLRGEPLTAVHAWQAVGPSTVSGFVGPDAAELGAQRRMAEVALAEAMAGRADRYPQVEVRRRVIRGDERLVLVEVARSASLLVVARHASHAVGSWGLGGVARHCLAEAAATVVVTPPSRRPSHRPHLLESEVPVQPQF